MDGFFHQFQWVDEFLWGGRIFHSGWNEFPGDCVGQGWVEARATPAMELLSFEEEKVGSGRGGAPALISIRRKFPIIGVVRLGLPPRCGSARREACNDRQD